MELIDFRLAGDTLNQGAEMEAKNLLFILSDQHRRDALGCYGHEVVRTPHLDALAARGTRFSNAYTNCPICVPVRASLATGRYVHQIGNWDNGFPYDGQVPSWGHHLKAQGFRVDSIGKLHFRSPADDNGFTEEIDPLHVVDGIGDVLGCIRENALFRKKRGGIQEAGPGESTYLQYDASNADQACRWLQAHRADDKPWVLFLSFVCPHPPYIAPADIFSGYPLNEVPLPPLWREEEWSTHPVMDYFRRYFDFARPFDEAVLRRLAATYYAVCTYLDQRIGQVLETLRQSGLEEDTRIIYTSDHGECLGSRGLFGKFTLHDEAAAIPFIMAGPQVPVGKVVETPVSLVDCFPSVLEAVGATPVDGDLPGGSLWEIARAAARERTVFSEYHAVGSRSASYMLRRRQFKYLHHVGEAAQLFDLAADPLEQNDLLYAPECRSLVADFKRELRALLDPEAVDARAKVAQRAKVEEAGGEEAVRKKGAFDNSPVPGEVAVFKH